MQEVLTLIKGCSKAELLCSEGGCVADTQTGAGRGQLNCRGAALAADTAQVSRSFFFFLVSFTGKKSNIVNPG